MTTIETLYSIYQKHTTITTDSRAITQGCLFFALKGPSFNGNTFAAEALNKGAAYTVVDDATVVKNERFILVADVLQSLQDLANHHRRQLKCQVLAITGSNGKTTTKELTARVLSKKYKTHFTQGNLNNHIGVPLTILSASHDTEMLIVEMGANHLHEIELLCRIAEPAYGIITNVGKAHLEGFGSFSGVMKAKGELYEFLAGHEGTAFINAGNPHLLKMLSRKKRQVKRIVGYADEKVEIKQVVCKGKLLETFPFLKVEWKVENPNMKIKDNFRVSTQIIGDYNFENIIAAICIGNYFDVPVHDINAAIEEYVPSGNRSQVIKKSSNTIILDAYNANPTSLAAALRNFAAMNTNGHEKVVMVGEMAELGKESEKEHRAIGKLIDKLDFSRVILVGKNFDQRPANHRFLVFGTVEEAINHVKGSRPENSFILIKGSRSARMERMIEGLS